MSNIAISLQYFYNFLGSLFKTTFTDARPWIGVTRDETILIDKGNEHSSVIFQVKTEQAIASDGDKLRMKFLPKTGTPGEFTLSTGNNENRVTEVGPLCDNEPKWKAGNAVHTAYVLINIILYQTSPNTNFLIL